MTRFLSSLTLNLERRMVALALGGLAVFAQVAPAHTVTVHEKELLTSVDRRQDHVAPAELGSGSGGACPQEEGRLLRHRLHG